MRKQSNGVKKKTAKKCSACNGCGTSLTMRRLTRFANVVAATGKEVTK